MGYNPAIGGRGDLKESDMTWQLNNSNGSL